MRKLGQYLVRSLQTGFARRWMTEVSPGMLGRSAVVFSPHADDETLGCGGTLIKKRAAGATVKIAFMTDGRTSHGHLMPADRLIALRAQEAVAAAQVLGLAESDVCFLGFPVKVSTYQLVVVFPTRLLVTFRQVLISDSLCH